VLPLNNHRQACQIQNAGTHAMQVYFGPIASASASTWSITPGQTINCTAGLSIIIKSQVSITGTTGDAFYYSSY
jgi:hypothetical protein